MCDSNSWFTTFLIGLNGLLLLLLVGLAVGLFSKLPLKVHQTRIASVKLTMLRTQYFPLSQD